MISVLMPTFGRVHLLQEMLHCLVEQDVKIPFEIVILNDYAKQTLSCPLDNVRIINTQQRYKSIGDKRNALLEMAGGDLIAWADDDDLVMPWFLSRFVDRIGDKDAISCNNAFYFHEEKRRLYRCFWCLDGLFRREKMKRFRSVSYGEDDFWKRDLENVEFTDDSPAYVYHYRKSIIHASYRQADVVYDNTLLVTTNMRVFSGSEPKGNIEIMPVKCLEYDRILNDLTSNQALVDSSLGKHQTEWFRGI